jgi:pseudouridine synthase
MEERLQKIISRAGLASRRQAEQMIAHGRVRVDGEVVTKVGVKADPTKNDIRVDGVRVRAGRPRRYILLNKPSGYLTTRSDPGRRPTVMELLPISLRSLYPVGRLDMSTSGLLLLTDDGELAQRVAHPRYGVLKTYLATVRGVPDERALRRAQKGIWIEGERLRVASVEKLGTVVARSRSPRGARGAKPKSTSTSGPDKTHLRVVLTEGRNREILRLFKALGHPVLELHREKIGSLTARGLRSGAYRALTSREISRLLAGPQTGPQTSPKTSSRTRAPRPKPVGRTNRGTPKRSAPVRSRRQA